MKILYLSTQNIGRSIIAESISRKYETENIKAQSAGCYPRDDIHPVVHRVLKGLHFSSVNLVSKSWNNFANWQPDIVITLCDKVLKEKCPSYVGNSTHTHWGLPDPEKQVGNMEENYTKIFHILNDRIKKLLVVDLENMTKEELRTHLTKVKQ